jgi:hypothetical protein
MSWKGVSVAEGLVRLVLESKEKDVYKVIQMLNDHPYLKNEGILTLAVNLMYEKPGTKRYLELQDDIFITACNKYAKRIEKLEKEVDAEIKGSDFNG